MFARGADKIWMGSYKYQISFLLFVVVNIIISFHIYTIWDFQLAIYHAAKLTYKILCKIFRFQLPYNSEWCSDDDAVRGVGIFGSLWVESGWGTRAFSPLASFRWSSARQLLASESPSRGRPSSMCLFLKFSIFNDKKVCLIKILVISCKVQDT